MSETKFTPGPLIACIGTYGNPVIEHETEHGIVNGGYRIAELHGPDAEPNSKLFAASPDLYAACKKFIKEYQCNCGENAVALGDLCPFCVASAALKKAEGGE